ncbi:methyltransferase domain-containing protein [Legionella oakridgensis]|uniref:2-polyprenyl-3-methyl-5-hydroxy-6-metoxy-1, 4-benzoquinol methylase n=3 Tax=Legionella oakridgensis TaxID=29423 RepID=W0BFX1_9GAMM|nr:methyltransferase domain-containing protein [Legionella oakridgensis]AHE67601.1 2-polyprenyl-3-methyl-5-hydroxy-6-metoxy-1,4-benzoquinol methylase [Legionella oakridgensis ATCC 33761 = DSM 21215]ETO92840.1 2-polyprenyl-3-methyl-5-hydroxy-6-metoxy-1,4-benzoquinol methylase [Legionella oakridgensis RV-2-2007]KTD37053.1 methyltransferase [Legionella oakridgensis]STY20638.1 methyltransferase [Legionella longbeachae]
MLRHRSQKEELMDLGSDFYTKEEYEQCLRQLFRMNKMLGIFKHTVKVLKNFSKTASITDVGCGGGLFLLHLSKYYPDMQMVGIDISKDAIILAQHELEQWRKNNKTQNVSFELQGKHELELSCNSRDVILLNLVCHHLKDEELIIFLKKAIESVRIGLIINDLHRNTLAYWLYKILCPLFFRNRLIRYDGLVSIERSFTRQELNYLLRRANIYHYQIKWCFPFRWSVVVWKNERKG